MEPIEWGLMLGGIIAGFLGRHHGRKIVKTAVKAHRQVKGHAQSATAGVRKTLQEIVEEAETELAKA